METWLSICGFLIVIAIVAGIISKKVTPVVALAVFPLIGAILAGQFTQIPSMVSSGLSSVAGNGVVFMFSILFFGALSTAGAFDPIVKVIVRLSRGNPVYVCIGTYILTIVSHLDTSATTDVLLVIPAMLPIFRKMRLDIRVLLCILALAGGAMNTTPWSGPSMRLATVLEMDVGDFFGAMLIPFLLTMVVGLIMTIFMGIKEKRRLDKEGFDYTKIESAQDYAEEVSEEEQALRRPKRTVINLILLVVAFILMDRIGTGPTFILCTALVFIINYPTLAQQRQIMKIHGASAVLVVSTMFAAGILMGVLSESGMSTAMANSVVSIVPDSMAGIIPIAVGVLSVPLSLAFDADSFIYGIVPVLSESVSMMGLAGSSICYATVVGMQTLGWPISPLNAATLLMTGMSGVELADHQKFSIPRVWFLSVVMLIFMILFGLIL